MRADMTWENNVDMHRSVMESPSWLRIEINIEVLCLECSLQTWSLLVCYNHIQLHPHNGRPKCYPSPVAWVHETYTTSSHMQQQDSPGTVKRWTYFLGNAFCSPSTLIRKCWENVTFLLFWSWTMSFVLIVNGRN